jgi:2'-5' RNA ligase
MRIFVALDISAEIRERLIAYMEKMRRHAPQSPWVRPESLHVTLKFIGETSDARVRQVKEALAQIRLAAFPVEFKDVGFFPDHASGRVFWAGVHGGHGLQQLAERTDEAMESLGIEREKRAYHPHLSLARSGSRNKARHSLKELKQALNPEEHPVFGTMTAREFFLYQSELLRGGARYTKLERFPLEQA